MNYQHFFTEKKSESNIGKTIRLGNQFDDFFETIHYSIMMKEKLPQAIHSILDLNTNKVICVLRTI